MRSDEALGLGEEVLSRGRFGGEPGNTNSLSGHERNRLFLRDGTSGAYVEVSPVSGVDHQADGRSFAVLDMDRDGWQDIVVVNANDPLTLLYRNRGADGALPATAGGFLAVRCVGGNATSAPAPGLACRDAIGAEVSVRLGGRVLRRQVRAGEGLSAQNSATLLIGLDGAARADEVQVRWPAGHVSRIADVAAGTLLTIHEPAGPAVPAKAIVAEPYQRTPAPPAARPEPDSTEQFAILDRPGVRSDAALTLYITTATWCVACAAEVPLVRRLREAFDEGELALVALPIDPAESHERLAGWMAKTGSPCRLLAGLSGADIGAVKDLLVSKLTIEATPSSILVDDTGRIRGVQWGTPSVSDIRGHLRALER